MNLGRVGLGPGLACLLLVAPASSAGAAQEAAHAITNAGVVRAALAVDSVYLDGLIEELVIPTGDFASYLMARLGVTPIPEPLGFRVTGDTASIRLAGRVADLPPEARSALGPIVAFLAPSTSLEAWITLRPEVMGAVRFRLDRAAIGGVPVPEDVVAIVMREVGRDYPALSASGRNLDVQVPQGSGMALVADGVWLRAPPRPS